MIKVALTQSPPAIKRLARFLAIYFNSPPPIGVKRQTILKELQPDFQ